MKVTVDKSRKPYCVFCDEDKEQKSGLTIYKFIRQGNSGLMVSICQDCVIELHEKSQKISGNELGRN
jgi:hypothetical protein